MKATPDQIICYFLKNQPDLAEEALIEGDTIWCRGTESLKPGIIQKTLKALALINREFNYDYVIRTNLSSFYVFPRLLSFCRTLPKRGCYTGVPVGADAVSGAGMILSADLIAPLLSPKFEHLWEEDALDDTLVGLAMLQMKIPRRSAPRVDALSISEWAQMKESLPEEAFHFRFKNRENNRTTDELQIYQEAVKLFYPKAI